MRGVEHCFGCVAKTDRPPLDRCDSCTARSRCEPGAVQALPYTVGSVGTDAIGDSWCIQQSGEEKCDAQEGERFSHRPVPPKKQKAAGAVRPRRLTCSLLSSGVASVYLRSRELLVVPEGCMTICTFLE